MSRSSNTGSATRNAILLIDHSIGLAREHASGISLVPLALAADQPGKELLDPVAKERFEARAVAIAKAQSMIVLGAEPWNGPATTDLPGR